MLRILIVDDEAVFRRFTKTVLESKNLDIEICGEAKNGRDALALLEEHPADLALVDISMPVMDGLEFSRIAREKHPGMEIVLLTGHDEFEYAKMAIKLSIHDYILKPFDENELTQTVQEVRQKILAKRNADAERQRYEAAANQIYAHSLISDSFSDTEAEVTGFLQGVAEGRNISRYRLVVVEEDYYSEGWNTHGRRDLWKTAVINVLDEIFNPDIPHLAFSGSSSNVVVILMFEAPSAAAKYDYADFHSLSRITGEKLGFSITCAVGDVFGDIHAIRTEYNKVCEIINNKFIVGNGKVIDRRITEMSANYDLYPVVPHQEIVQLLKNKDLGGLCKNIDSLFDTCLKNKLSMDYICMLYMELVNICLTYIAQRGMELTAIYGESFYPYTDLKNLQSLEDAKKRVVNIYRAAVDSFATRHTRSAEIAELAKDIINRNYSDNSLTVDGIAQGLYINGSYLRSAFKKETGTTVSSYLFATRMEEARRLILEKPIKITDISEMVGFSDISYFSKCFKKHYGVSPSEYAISTKKTIIGR